MINDLYENNLIDKFLIIFLKFVIFMYEWVLSILFIDNYFKISIKNATIIIIIFIKFINGHFWIKWYIESQYTYNICQVENLLVIVQSLSSAQTREQIIQRWLKLLGWKK